MDEEDNRLEEAVDNLWSTATGEDTKPESPAANAQSE
jgi:hypothetical protein